MYYIVCYDIGSNTRRYRVSKHLQAYGKRVQHSVFEIYIRHERDLTALIKKLKKLMQEDDRICFYHFPENARQRSQNLNNQPIAYIPSSIII